uniref:Thiol-disulfide oxidoreductase DCC n=2 Tax=Chloropicon primus TaxID=1764295 RepID=A0A7S2SYR9_9CHLO|mmetsp:Transcript_1334/g.3838  ORF Transcript_1334/g.3838 Transcript_1334/m.3838 type:complete len:198 (+) Transcript_1334:170-763(+)
MMTSALVFRSRGTELLRRVQSSLVVGSRRTWTQRSSRAYSTGGLRDDGATATATTTATAYEDVSWKIRMLYDGACPLCMREVNMLRRRDEQSNKIDFVDIASAEYDPRDNQGITFEEAMGKIHAITNEGEVVTNVEVFRRLYDLVGLGWVFAITKTEPFGTIVDKVYDVWAAYRLPITGREDLEVILAKRNQSTMCK